MAIFKRNSGSSSGGSPAGYDAEKHADPKADYTHGTGEVVNTDASGVAIHTDNAHLHRGLKSRHITMIAIGGAIGTGLIIGTGKALAQSG